MRKESKIEEITGLIPEEELSMDLGEADGGVAVTPIISAITAVTMLTATSPCPTSACSKSC